LVVAVEVLMVETRLLEVAVVVRLHLHTLLAHLELLVKVMLEVMVLVQALQGAVVVAAVHPQLVFLELLLLAVLAVLVQHLLSLVHQLHTLVAVVHGELPQKVLVVLAVALVQLLV
jgi:hypothetical protein